MSDDAVPVTVLVAGNANADLVAVVSHRPRGGETVLARSLARYAGGKGANQAAAAARAGARVCFVVLWGTTRPAWTARRADRRGRRRLRGPARRRGRDRHRDDHGHPGRRELHRGGRCGERVGQSGCRGGRSRRARRRRAGRSADRVGPCSDRGLGRGVRAPRHSLHDQRRSLRASLSGYARGL